MINRRDEHPDKDRITLAWELRRDIHAWLKRHVRASLPEIIRAFSTINRETVRKAIYRMRLDGDVELIERTAHCNTGIYAVVTPLVKSELSKRNALAKGAYKAKKIPIPAALKKPIEPKETKPAQEKKQPDPPWRTTNKRFDDPHAKPYRNQGGQGTVGVMPRGYCAILGE